MSERERVGPLRGVVVGALLLALGPLCVGCGSSGGSSPASKDLAAVPAPSSDGRGFIRPDGDADNPRDIDGNPDPDYEDGDEDYPTPESYDFPDADDEATLGYGNSANGPEGPAIAAIVQRYYAAGARRDGARACRLLVASLARSVPEDYGSGAGPAYLRGGRSCPAVMVRLFAHLRYELSEAIKLVSVRVKGDQALVVLGSARIPASALHLQSEGGSWRIVQLLATPLP